MLRGGGKKREENTFVMTGVLIEKNVVLEVPVVHSKHLHHPPRIHHSRRSLEGYFHGGAQINISLFLVIMRTSAAPLDRCTIRRDHVMDDAK